MKIHKFLQQNYVYCSHEHKFPKNAVFLAIYQFHVVCPGGLFWSRKYIDLGQNLSTSISSHSSQEIGY